MSLRHLNLLRRFSTTQAFCRPKLSADYKSIQLWETRLNCNLLGADSNLIKTINNKIISGVDLNNLEIDVFINIASPRTDDIAQLQEAISNLRRSRKTIYANNLLPSTSHALCRLFINSGRFTSLINVLERRVEFGIFHDPFALNLLFDVALEQGDYALGSRLSTLIMLQEEFGFSQLNDNFALYSLGKYTESKTDFLDWCPHDASQDPIFEEFDALQDSISGQKDEETKKADDYDDGDEDEDEKEYIRVPFLRNEYFDNHFDLIEPRLKCGKTLSMLGMHYLGCQDDKTKKLGMKCRLLGHILQGSWSEAQAELNGCMKSEVTANSLYTDTIKHYLTNLNSLVEEPEVTVKKSLMIGLDNLSTSGGLSLSEESEQIHESLRDIEKQDIQKMKSDLEDWSRARLAFRQAQDDFVKRNELIAEIKRKKEELKLREQYLYFYDNLKSKNLMRIEYD